MHDLKEQVLDPARQFLNSEQVKIYDAAKALLDEIGANVAQGATAAEARELRQLLEDPNCHRGRTMQRVKVLTDSLRGQNDALVGREREAAAADMETAWQEVLDDPRYAALPAERQAALAGQFAAATETIGRHVLVDAIRGAAHTFQAHTLPAIWEDLRQGSLPVVREGDSAPEAPAEPVYVHAAALPVDYHKPSIDDETDAGRYLEALRDAITRELRGGRRITL